MSLMKKLRSDATGVTYADPTDPDFTCRFKFSTAKKTIDGNSVTNQVTEIIYNVPNDVAIGSCTASDPISVRVKISGSHLSESRIAAILDCFCHDCPTWQTEGVLTGFEPTTAPTASLV